MADRVSASITIGGTLPATALAGLAATIHLGRLSTEWDGAPFTLDDMPENAPLSLMAPAVPWGRFDPPQAFCLPNGLCFAPSAARFLGQVGADRPGFPGH